MNKTKNEIATLGGGCFWCTEAIFKTLKGVSSVVSGYMGGSVPGKPTYREICSGLTGHAEVVQINYNPSAISFSELLIVFMTTHNPTTLNQQGGDVGTQYRSVIFYHTTAQEHIANTVLKEITKYFQKPIVTKICSSSSFYKAEDYHQTYYTNNPEAQYCQLVIAPKLEKLRALHADKVLYFD